MQAERSIHILSRWARAARSAASATVLLTVLSGAQAANIVLSNTGVDAVGNPLAPGSVDPHWQLVAGPGVTAPAAAFVVTNQHPFGNYFETTDSMWIWVDADGSVAPGGPYTFRLQFDLTGLNPATASINGFWGIDDSDASIALNGAAPTGTGLTLIPTDFDNFNVQHGFSITGGFVSGINTLDITVTDVSNPGALNVTRMAGTADAAVSGAVPEPASLALVGAGLLIMVGVRRQSRVLPTLHIPG